MTDNVIYTMLVVSLVTWFACWILGVFIFPRGNNVGENLFIASACAATLAGCITILFRNEGLSAGDIVFRFILDVVMILFPLYLSKPRTVT